MIIRLKKMWSGSPPGHIFSGLHPGMAKTLVERGYAEPVEAKKKRQNKAKPKPKEKRDDDIQSESNERANG